MKLRGKAHKFGDDINTDYIISGKYKFKTLDMQELAKHVMEDIDPDFYKKVSPGDFIVAGKNFGCGSSREQAPRALLASGIKGVLAKSFARIFFRNAINCGLLVLECDTSPIESGDELEVDLKQGLVVDLSRNLEVRAQPLPEVMIQILEEGGLVPYFKKYGSFQGV
ncbi:MAG: 3-isopropylmalate/(R)-2-methylmalate dehydratase small subunit [Candidatus Atribacteria bacterium]|jgi:3-isopropylmalate/(R)-2-methylmalate dehydratase small subunit|uniref:3-isopropylmalate dehydratase small subunit n=1 Tax=Thermatribacter velox TaxID=3039681 RepID=A0ABZ2YCD3_9BACT|nr:3-isopropylmalate/(R)-2-methylmalate dehydratase small subunit [Candidatus Atribacteria bacterium]MDI3530286.1 3-isopropylmalate/(R)-2-methylmalate dehydratase small subunit [Candidatus Atribacteria bacterium]